MLNDAQIGKTPMLAPIRKRYEWPKITLRKEGFQDSVFYMQSRLNPVTFIGSWFMPYSFAIDGITGKIVYYKKRRYDIMLQKESSKEGGN